MVVFTLGPAVAALISQASLEDARARVLVGIVAIAWALVAGWGSWRCWRRFTPPPDSTLPGPTAPTSEAPPTAPPPLPGLPCADSATLLPDAGGQDGGSLEAFGAWATGAPPTGAMSSTFLPAWSASPPGLMPVGGQLPRPPSPSPLARVADVPVLAPLPPGGLPPLPYAPLTVPTDPSAKQVQDMLRCFSHTRTSDPFWGRRFWAWVAGLEAQGIVSAEVLRVLRAYGYVGQATITLPRDVEILAALDLLTTAPAPAGPLAAAAPASGSVQPAGILGNPQDGPAGPSSHRWAAALPPDYRRAAPEIFRNIRAAGCDSTRAWLQTMYTGSRASKEWIELWTMATSADFALATARDEEQLQIMLGTNDQVEMSLRHLSAYVYESRTRDRVGAAHMRAVVAPGASSDIAPSWLVPDSPALSRGENADNRNDHSDVKDSATDDSSKASPLH